MKKRLLPAEKIALIIRVQSGESVASVCKETGISRTIFYRWLKAYGQTKPKMQTQALRDHYPTGEKHWRHIPGSRDLVLNLVKEHPEYSAEKISSMLQERSGEHVLSSYGVYRILKDAHLTTEQERQAFSQQKRHNITHSDKVPDGEIATKAVHTKQPSFYRATENHMLHFFFNAASATVTVFLFFGVFAGIIYFTDLPSANQHDQDKKVLAMHEEKIQDRTTEESQIPPITQDFAWGVLALNTNKATYQLGDKAHITFGILDNLGRTLCNANIVLVVTPPNKKMQFLTIRNGGVKIQHSCGGYLANANPDYDAWYAITQSGQYNLELIAETKNGAYRITDSFQAGDTQVLSLERSAATRIYPPNYYSMTIDVVAQKDFSGTLKESLPATFHVLYLADTVGYGTIEEEGKRKVLVWKVDLKKGEKVRLGYQLRTPIASPAFYMLDPMQVYQGARLVQQEARAWHIAVDRPMPVRVASGAAQTVFSPSSASSSANAQ